MLTVYEVAEDQGVDPSTVRAWIRSGKLKALQLPTRHYRIQESAYEEFKQWRSATAEQVAAVLKLSPVTIRKMLREKQIEGYKEGKTWRVTDKQVLQEILPEEETQHQIATKDADITPEK